MRTFLDTEFTNFTDPMLISFGLVAENGREFYAELSDGWQPEQCSVFVQDVVLPRMERSPASTVCRSEAGIKLVDWFSSLGNKVTLIHDAEVDGHLFAKLLLPVDHSGIILDPQLLHWPGSAMARHHELLMAKTQSGETMRHHALVDARVLRQSVLQTEADFRR